MNRRMLGRLALCVVVVGLVVAGGLVVAVATRPHASPSGATTAQPGSADGAKSTHGADVSQGSRDGHRFVVCDVEADGNPVQGVFEVGSGDAADRVAMEDEDGADGTCASVQVEGTITRHRTCERNLVAWDCDNWTTNEWPPPDLSGGG